MKEKSQDTSPKSVQDAAKSTIPKFRRRDIEPREEDGWGDQHITDREKKRQYKLTMETIAV